MKLPDYDSQFCGSLPLAFINQVQPYGFLVVTDLDLNVIQVSDNVNQFIPREVDELLKLPLKSVFNTKWEDFDHKVAGKQKRFVLNVRFEKDDKNISLLAIFHLLENYIVIEIEKPLSAHNSFLDVYQQIRTASTEIQEAGSLAEALTIAASELKKISGFDKVMIYRFDEAWNGHVVAEDKSGDMETYLNLTFPASDIPRQARELYLKNPYRQIPDINYRGAKLLPVINPITSAFTDLSDCNLRAVPKVHLEYLANMKVVASMSTRILKDNKLWGLISCHHREAKFLTYDECSMFELLSGIISIKLTSLDVSEDLKWNKERQYLQEQVVTSLYAADTFRDGFKSASNAVMQLLNCSGVAWVTTGTILREGECPSATIIENMSYWLQSLASSEPYTTSSLSDDFEEGISVAEIASGIIALPLIPESGEYIIAFRKELPQEIHWGGNPDDAISFEPDNTSYHPRNSFALWQQSIRHSSAPFTRYDIEFARALQRIFLSCRLTEISKN